MRSLEVIKFIPVGTLELPQRSILNRARRSGRTDQVRSARGPVAVAGVLARSRYRSSIDRAAASRYRGLALGSLAIRARSIELKESSVVPA
jgi:hypothetical protein